MKKNEAENEVMTFTLEFDDRDPLTCAVVTILSVNGRSYIAALPLDDNGSNSDGEVLLYRYDEDPENPDAEPVISYIEDDDEYDAVSDAFDEYLDNCEFDELIPDEETEEE